MGAATANLAIALALLLAAVGGLLFVVGAIAYRRTGQIRLAWVALGMAGLGAQGVLYAMRAYEQRGQLAAGTVPFPDLLWFDLVVIGAIYMAVLKR